MLAPQLAARAKDTRRRRVSRILGGAATGRGRPRRRRADQRHGSGEERRTRPELAPGPQVRAKVTVLTEGCRGSVGKVVRSSRCRRELRCRPWPRLQEELWRRCQPGRVEPGLIQRAVGWPLDSGAYGGSFLCIASRRRRDTLASGYVVGLQARPRLDLSSRRPAVRAPPVDRAAARRRRDRRRRRALDDHRRSWRSMPQARDAGRPAGRRRRGALNMSR